MASWKHGATWATLAWVASCRAAGAPPTPAHAPAAPPPPTCEQTSCIPTPGAAAPLTAGFTAEARHALEDALEHGIVVVAVSCNRIRLLNQCHAPGSYAFAGLPSRSVHLTFPDPATVRINLPMSAEDRRPWAAHATATVRTVGAWTAPFEAVTREALEGACDGATHVIHRAWAGTGDERDRSESVSCPEDNGTADRPARACQSIVRLELEPLRDSAARSRTENAGLTPPCPRGWEWGEALCTRAGESKLHLCAPDDKPDCERQCAAGHPSSCYNLGRLVSLPHAWQRACNGNEARGCHAMGDALAAAAKEHESAPTASSHYIRGCELGFARSCRAVAETAAGHTPAIEAYDRGCALGDPVSCAVAGRKRLEAAGGGQEARGWEQLGRSCLGGAGSDCWVWGRYLGEQAGRPIPGELRAYRIGCLVGHLASCNAAGEWLLASAPDRLSEARVLFARACSAEGVFHWDGCLNLAGMLEGGTSADKATALRSYEQVCRARVRAGCAAAARMVERGEGAAAAPRRAADLYGEGCRVGDLEACDEAARLWRGIDPGRALELDKAACVELRHKPACDRAKGR